MDDFAEQGLWVCRVVGHSCLYQFLSHHIINVEQIVSVLTSVLQHLFVERSQSPISELILLVSTDLTVALEEIPKAFLRQAQGSRSPVCIKQVDYVKAKVTLKPFNIAVSSM